jgi:D-alanyl-D-alanine carboxypeptidase/D-alanyl-D-alanine-endopeptidase (penicillin-binding protein 4)
MMWGSAKSVAEVRGGAPDSGCGGRSPWQAVLTQPASASYETTVYSSSDGAGLPLLCAQPVGDPSLSDAGLRSLVHSAVPSLDPGSIDDVALQVSAPAAPTPSSWEWADLDYYYGATPAASTINNNTIDLTISPGASVGDPLAVSYPTPADGSAGVSVDASSSSTTTHAHEEEPTAGYKFDPSSGAIVLSISGSLALGAVPLSVKVAVRAPAALFAAHFAAAAQAEGVGGATPAVSLLPAGAACETSSPVGTLSSPVPSLYLPCTFPVPSL